MALEQQSLVAQLRRRVKDERVGRLSFRLACIDEAATDCLVAISAAGVLTTNAINSRVASNLSIDLSAHTVKSLVETLQRSPGYQVVVEQDCEPDHPAEDLEVVGSMSILGEACAFKHHLFSDAELLEILDGACRRHNLNYTPETVPTTEYIFVCTLGHAEVLRRLASDSAKRRNLEQSAEQLLEIARDLEDSYARDTRRQQRVIPVARVDESELHQGDVTQGTISRRSLRSGFFAPMADGGGLLSSAVLEEPDPSDVEDIKVTIRWKRNRDLHFYSYELWRDTQPDVRRPSSLPPQAGKLLRDQVKQPYTAWLVFRSFSGNVNRDNIGWATFVEQSGQLITSFTDCAQPPLWNADGGMPSPPLEPETDYYYRLFITSLNYETVGSNVVGVRTKSMRALLSAPPTLAISPAEGVTGTPITIRGTGFHQGMTVSLGGRPLTLAIGDAQTATSVVPAFYNPAAVGRLYDIVLKSSNGLTDVLSQGFKYKGAA